MAAAPLNLRADCSAEAELVGSVPEGTELTSTGVSDTGWIEVVYNGHTCYVSGDYVTQTQTSGDTQAAGTADGAAVQQ